MRCCFLKQINNRNSQKQQFTGVLQNRCSQKFHYNHRKTSVLDSVFIKKKLKHRCFSVNIAKFVRADFCYRTPMAAASELESKLDQQCKCQQKQKKDNTNQTNLTKKIYFFSYIVNINKDLKKINEKKHCFKPV